MKFLNILFEHPVCFNLPERNISSTWIEHVPFGMFMVDVSRPKILVEIGAYIGASYFAFCQVVKKLKINTKCFGIYKWPIDIHSESFSPEQISEIIKYHDLHYGGFSQILKSTGEENIKKFSDNSIDFLHINGLRTYENVKNEFRAWFPKLSEKAIILIHDINKRGQDFSVWKFWEELKKQYPHFEFWHGYGLGVLGVGKALPEELIALFNIIEEDAKQLRKFFYILGSRILLLNKRNQYVNKFNAILRGKNARIEELEMKIFDREKELNKIYNSHGWKALLIYYKIKNKFFLMNRTFGKIISNLFKMGLNVFRIKKSFKKRILWGETNYVNPIISVIIPTFNRKDMLKESIESILNQTYPNFELILVCDGSPLETMNIIKKYESNPKVRIFKYKDNSGNPVRGRNKGIKEARGKYIAFQDDDDIAEKKRLEISLKYAEKYNADVVYGMWRAKKESEYDKEVMVEDGEIVKSIDYDYSTMLKGINFICQSTVMVRKETLRKAGGLKYEMKYCEDYELWLRLGYLGCKFKYIPEILTNLRLHSNNLEKRFKKEKNKYIHEAIDKHKTIPKLKPTVGFFIPGQGISGGIMVICQHANRLVKKGFDVILININLNDPFKLDWFPDLLPDVIPLNKVNQKIDIAFATQWSTVFHVKDFPAKKKIYFIQSDESRFYPPGSKEEKMARETYYSFNFDEYIVVSRWLKEWLKNNFGKSAYYVPNGLDPSLFYPDKPIEPKTGKLRVLLEGAIEIPYKGMEESFKVVEDIDCEVWCISYSGRPKPGWRCDRFFEKVPLEKMRLIYSSCDVLIKMSKVEGFFMPPLEMMACGGTVITSKVTGYDEYIIDGYNGLVVEPGDVEAAKEKLKMLSNDRELLRKLIKGGLETAKRWTWDYSNDKLEKIISAEQRGE